MKQDVVRKKLNIVIRNRYLNKEVWYVFVKASDCVQAVFQQEGSRYAFSMSAGMFLNPSAPLSKACTHSLKVLCTHLKCCRMYIGFEWNVVHEWIKTRQIMENKF